MIVAKKLIENIEKLLPIVNSNSLKITISVGVASNLKHHKSIADIQRDADYALYHAKMDGRNRVSCLNMPCYVELEMAKEN